jgi:hypothetical protein
MTLHDLVRLAVSLDGIGAAPANPGRARFVELVTPAYVAASDCAIVQIGILRALGCRHPLLDAPTRTQRAFGDLLRLAGDAGALRDTSAIGQGCMVMVGDMGDGIGGGPGHVWLALSELDAGGVCLGLDGGQRDEHGYQEIRTRWHTLAGGMDRASTTDPGGGSPRLVRHVLDAAAMAAALGPA